MTPPEHGAGVGAVRAAECHPDRPHHSRGLCRLCYQRAWRAGTLEQHPLSGQPLPGRPVTCVAIAEDASWVLDCGCRCHQDGPKVVHGNGRACPCGGQAVLAQRLGISKPALARALLRARRRGVMVA